MTISGPEALRSIEEALRDIRREEDDLAKRLGKSADMIARIKQQEGELLRHLANVRLDPAVQNELSGELSSAERKARDMLKAHGAALTDVEAKLKGLDTELAALAASRSEALAEVARAESALAVIAERAKPALEARDDYKAALATAQSLVRVADESLTKTQQAEEDRETKGRRYRDDPLFSYLWERGYGTRNYRANSLIAFLDGWVARLAGYAEARPNFAMLNDIPLRLREHAERQKANATEALSALQVLEAKAIDDAGGAGARDTRDAARLKIEDIDKQVVALQDQRDEATKAQRELAQGSDPAFAAAIAALAEALGRADARTLLEQARQTSTGEDDTLVQQIDDARQRVGEEESESSDLKGRLKILAGRRRELEDIQYEFKKSGYDRPQSRFDEDNLVGDVLNDFLRGGISAARYWDMWQRNQNWGGGGRSDWTGGSGGFSWPENSFGGGGSNRRPGGGWGPSPGRPSSGTGFSRPRTGSGGSRPDGGFKTGGGF
jgi:hypothetical protein